jgi:hypothetical protein
MRKVRGIALATAVGLISAGPVMASAHEPDQARASTSSVATPAVKFCVILIGKAAGPSKISPVRHRSCSSKSEKDAEAHFSSPEVRAKLGKDFDLSGATKLVALFEDPYFGGSGVYIWGDSGPCDRSGYKINVSAAGWESRLSSVKRANTHCNHAAYYDLDAPYANDATVPTYRFSSRLDNRIDYFQVCDGWCP